MVNFIDNIIKYCHFHVVTIILLYINIFSSKLQGCASPSLRCVANTLKIHIKQESIAIRYVSPLLRCTSIQHQSKCEMLGQKLLLLLSTFLNNNDKEFLLIIKHLCNPGHVLLPTWSPLDRANQEWEPFLSEVALISNNMVPGLFPSQKLVPGVSIAKKTGPGLEKTAPAWHHWKAALRMWNYNVSHSGTGYHTAMGYHMASKQTIQHPNLNLCTQIWMC